MGSILDKLSNIVLNGQHRARPIIISDEIPCPIKKKLQLIPHKKNSRPNGSIMTLKNPLMEFLRDEV